MAEYRQLGVGTTNAHFFKMVLRLEGVKIEQNDLINHESSPRKIGPCLSAVRDAERTTTSTTTVHHVDLVAN